MKKTMVWCGLLAFCMMLPGTIVPAGTPSSNSGAGAGGNAPLSVAVEGHIDMLLRQLTLEEKITMLSGTEFDSQPIERLGIPALSMTDGPIGVRWGKATAFPVSIAMAASWDTSLVGKIGQAIGREARAKGRFMLLGPCLNINRVPQDGRDFESFGEDPYLTGRMAVSYVQGVQSQHVIATAKHFACNNQEWARDSINVVIDERALREIYLPAFRAAVQEGGAWSVMSAYNKVNGAWCSENPHLLTEILKKEWGFQGFVVSDWGAVHSTVPTALAGLDIEMPSGQHLAGQLLAAVRKGEVPVTVIDDKVHRLLRAMSWVGLFDKPQVVDPAVVNCAEHRAIALAGAQEGIVLLKNTGNLLPLDKKTLKTVAVVGPSAAVARTGGGGSSQVDPLQAISVLDGLKERAGTGVSFRYAKGCAMEGDMTPIPSEALTPAGAERSMHGLKGEYFDNMTLSGKPVLERVDSTLNFEWQDGSPGAGVPVDHFSARWTGSLVPPESGSYDISVQSDDGVRLFVDGKLVIENWNDHAMETRTVAVTMEKGRSYNLRMEYYENAGGAGAKVGWDKRNDSLMLQALEAARSADVAIVCVGTSNQVESEGFDRTTIDLPESQLALIKAVVSANPKTIVLLQSGAPVTMGAWIASVPAIVEAWFPGEEGGRAAADVLFGDVNPSGKLPVTFPTSWNECAANATYPGTDGATSYSEGVFVGYRDYDHRGSQPQFPFGYGLSYTTFAYSALSVQKTPEGDVAVECDVQNSGTRIGAEVVQLYVADQKSSVPRPPKELKRFAKVHLLPGESRHLRFVLGSDAFAYYDVPAHRWTVEPGTFTLMVGSSSRDIRLQGNVDVP